MDDINTLLMIDGIGYKKASEILKKCGSVEVIKKLTIREIAFKAELGDTLSAKIYEYFHPPIETSIKPIKKQSNTKYNEHILTSGRVPDSEFWKINATTVEWKHTPFLVFVEKTNTIEVVIVNSLKKLIAMNLPDDTHIMKQWAGEFRSDFFQFSLGELKTNM